MGWFNHQLVGGFNQGLGGLIIAKSTTRLDLRSWKTEKWTDFCFHPVFFHDNVFFFGRWIMFEVYKSGVIFVVSVQAKSPKNQKHKKMVGGFGGILGLYSQR